MHERPIAELFDLTGRTALITGGGGHLGRALANALAEAGARVAVGSRDATRAAALAAELPNSAAGHRGIVLDYADPGSLADGFATAVECCGAVDILVNNGHAGSACDWTNVTPEEFQRQLAMVTGYFELSRLLRNHVVARGAAGSIVLLGSMYGVVGSYPEAYAGIAPASPVHYHALKGGIVQMTRHLAVYWAKDHVRVNCLSPGPFPSDRAPAEMVARLKEKSPLGRMGRPEELKGALLLLVSDAGSYITGQNLLVDGGWTAW